MLCLCFLGTLSISDLQAATVFSPSDTSVAGPVPDLYTQMLSGLPDGANAASPGATPTGVVPDGSRSLQEAIFFTLLFGSTLRFLFSDTVRRFFHETLDPMNWNSY
jgi:hypothetical protein